MGVAYPPNLNCIYEPGVCKMRNKQEETERGRFSTLSNANMCSLSDRCRSSVASQKTNTNKSKAVA